MKKISALLVLALISIASVIQAQTSKEVLDKLSAKAKNIQNHYF
jgi:outer membrane lipoprotein-sorting protein